MLNTYDYFGDELELPIQVIRLNESNTPYDFGESHRHNYLELFLFKKGGGSHIIDFVDIKISDLSIHFVCSRKVHLLKRNSDSNGYIILFKREILNSSKEQNNGDFLFMLQNTSLQLSKSEYFTIEFLIQDLANTIDEQNEQIYEITKTILHLIILKCRKFKQESDFDFKPNPYYEFIVLLEDHFAQQSNIGYYAQKLSLSNEVLAKEVKRISGKSISVIIQERRLIETKRLLTHSDLSLKEIANYLNFNDSAHFTHTFKGKTGKTPTEYRENK